MPPMTSAAICLTRYRYGLPDVSPAETADAL